MCGAGGFRVSDLIRYWCARRDAVAPNRVDKDRSFKCHGWVGGLVGGWVGWGGMGRGGGGLWEWVGVEWWLGGNRVRVRAGDGACLVEHR